MPRDRTWPSVPDPLPGEVIDNHTHLQMALTWTSSGWPGHDVSDLDDHLAVAASTGASRAVECGCDLDALEPTASAVRHPALLGAIAIHPNEAVLHSGIRELAPDGLDPRPLARHTTSLDDAIAAVERVARSQPRIRAIGETGLDYFRSGPQGRAAQRESFRAHIALAKELGLALQIHDRDAHADVVEVLLADGAPERTVFHCFSGDVELARTCAEHRWFTSFSGTLTHKTNDALRAAAAVMPADLLMVETDAPYLTPVPHRGRPNSSYLVGLTVRELARTRGEDLARVCSRLTATTESVYGPW